jgi:acetylornithine deacetylase/succinyl-diaminopimelate desuccinylase-like protein
VGLGSGRANLVARLAGDGSKRPVLLYQHTDVVEAGEGWSCDPFAGETRDGFVWGRGAIDMKGMGVMEILAVDLLRREFPDPAQRCRDIVLFAAADEEGGGGAGTRWMLENHADQIDAEFVWDEGGFGVRDLFGPFPVFTVSVAEKKALWVRLVARGEPGARGYPARRKLRGYSRGRPRPAGPLEEGGLAGTRGTAPGGA